MYVLDEDRVSKRKVEDVDVNVEFQEALKHDPSLMIEQRDYVTKRWFGRKKVTRYFWLYHETPAYDGSPYMARHQCSGSGEKAIVIAYLHGIINGCTHKTKDQL